MSDCKWFGVGILFGFAAIAGCGPSKAEYASEIRAVIARDKANAPKGNLVEVILGLSQSSIDGYVVRLKEIDLSKCPADFQKAFHAHAKAWEDFAQAKRAGNSGLIDAGQRAVADTWLRVHQVATEYGVQDILNQ